MTITCFSISSIDLLPNIFILLNSIKHTKHPDTKIIYYLLLEFTEQKNNEYCTEYFNTLVSDDFKIELFNIYILKQLVDKKLGTPYAYLKCYATELFKDLNKVLYIDTDMVFVKDGIEELWNIDIEDYYLAAVEEPLVTYFMFQQLKNTKTKKYFNSGIMLMNLKRIRDQQLNRKMIDMIFNWDESILKPAVVEQSLLNYYLKDKIKFIDFKWNNSLLVATSKVLEALQKFLNEKYGKFDFKQSLHDAVVFHFLGQNKPWKEYVRENTTIEKDFPFKKTCLQIWDYLVKVYGKPEPETINTNNAINESTNNEQ